MTERKSRPLWPLLTAALIGLPVLYVASYGPAARLCQDGWISEDVLNVVFVPLAWGLGFCPSWVTTAFLRYAVFCGVNVVI
jgi:hypothetical protein